MNEHDAAHPIPPLKDPLRDVEPPYDYDIARVMARLGDRRAKDLIERNASERDPRRAIRRLHRALSYGRQSIQAAKAYRELGMYYEELGNQRRAILYYTKTIALDLELNIPPTYAFYKRGTLHYLRGEWQQASDDFRHAMESEKGGLLYFPDERVLAIRFLNDLDAEHDAQLFESRDGIQRGIRVLRQ